MVVQSVQYVGRCRPCLKKTGTPVIFWHNFIKSALILIILGILGVDNLYLVRN